MKRGPKPLGDKAMTGAERQARYRAAHADGTPRIRYRKPVDRRSRAQRWRDAVTELVTLQDDYRAWLDSLPENLADSATAEALQTICDLDLSELDTVEPPRRQCCDETPPPDGAPRHVRGSKRRARPSLSSLG
jgi:hypothetical protein